MNEKDKTQGEPKALLCDDLKKKIIKRISQEKNESKLLYIYELIKRI